MERNPSVYIDVQRSSLARQALTSPAIISQAFYEQINTKDKDKLIKQRITLSSLTDCIIKFIWLEIREIKDNGYDRYNNVCRLAITITGLCQFEEHAKKVCLQ